MNALKSKRIGMKLSIQLEIALCGCLVISPMLRAQSMPPQSPAKDKAPPSSQQAPAQKPEANPFPEDTSSIPVVPTTATPPAAPPAASNSSGETTSLLREDTDPIKSPDDPVGGASDSSSGFSSSSQGGDEVKIPDEPDKPGKRQKLDVPVAPQESAKQDESVGAYYLDRKNWKAALSRFESALVLDPENPDVYWGMAEAQRELGDYANAKANYLKVMEYDPDSKHSKEAKKYLKQPEIANAPAANQPGKPQQ